MSNLTQVTLHSVISDTQVDVSVSRTPIKGDYIMYKNTPFKISEVILLSGGGAICYTEHMANLESLSCIED